MASTMAVPLRAQNKVSLATAKVVPVFITLIFGYGSYAITGPLCIQFLLNPPPGIPRRTSAGLAIPIVFYLLLILVGATWLRLLIVVWQDPGYIPLGSPRQDNENEPAPGLEEFWTRDAFVCDARGRPIWWRKPAMPGNQIGPIIVRTLAAASRRWTISVPGLGV